MSPLTLVEYLKLLPTHEIYDRFLKKVERDRSIVSASRLNNLAHELSEPQKVSDRFVRLSPAAQKVCVAVYLSGDQGLKSFVKNNVQTELVDSLLVYPATDQAGAVFFLRFAEFRPHFEKLLLQKLDECCGVTLKTTAPASWAWRCVNDVVVLLLAASGGWLQQTKNNTLKKTTLQKLQRLMQCFDDNLFSAQHDKLSQQCLYMLVQFCKERRLVAARGQILQANEPAIAKWLAQPLHDCYFDIIEYIQDSSPLWDLELVRLWQSTLPRRACVPEKLFDDMTQWNLPLFMAVYLGFLVCQKSGRALAALPAPMISQLFDQHFNPQTSDQLIISGDFTVIFPQESAPRLLYNFARIGQVNSFDRVYHGKLSKESVTNSLVSGMDIPTLLELLEQFHAPRNVSETVKEWIREFGRLSMSSGTFIASSEEYISAQLMHLPALKNSLEPLNAHRVFLIKSGQENHVQEVLARLGFDCRMPLQPGAGEPGSNAEAFADEIEPESGAAPELFITKKELTPLIEPQDGQAVLDAEKSLEMKTGKYSGALKQLERSDLIHVLDYALIMGYTVTLDYSGSLGIKAGVYSVVPVSLNKGPQACFEGRSENSSGKKKFILEKIRRIGVRGE